MVALNHAMDSSPATYTLRVRVSGILIEEHQVLMVQVQSPVRKEPIWMPPGGGLAYGESLKEGVKREFLEETGLHIEPEQLLYVAEFIHMPIHALEYYWKCRRVGGTLRLGSDPEFDTEAQILRSVAFMDLQSLKQHPVYPEFLRERLAEDVGNARMAIQHYSTIESNH